MFGFFSAMNDTNTSMDTTASEFWNTSTITAVAVGGTVVVTCLLLSLWHRFNPMLTISGESANQVESKQTQVHEMIPTEGAEQLSYQP